MKDVFQAEQQEEGSQTHLNLQQEQRNDQLVDFGGGGAAGLSCSGGEGALHLC